MADLVLLGGGGHAISVLDALYRINEYKQIVLTDPDKKAGDIVLRSEVVGNDDCLEGLFNEGCRKAFISIGSIKDTSLRRHLGEKLHKFGYEEIIVLDPSAVISEFSNISEGVFVGKTAVINAASSIGRSAIINTGVIIEHECKIGDFTHIACGAVLCGGVTVGNDSFVGAGSKIVEGTHIGSNVVIGAGSTVLRDVADGESISGLVK